MTDAPENSNPIAYAIEDVPDRTGINRCKIFKAIRDKELRARKIGRSTIIEHNELRRWIASLPTRGRPQDRDDVAA
jgi:hypothetical protein